MDRLGVVGYTQRTWCNLSTHFPFASSSLFFIPSTMTLLVAFSLSVALKARRGRKSIPYTQLSIISFESLTIKLESVVRYESVGHLKPSDNIPQDKLFYVLIPYICEGLCFDPFSKVICPDKEPFSATCCSRERLERPWIGERV